MNTPKLEPVDGKAELLPPNVKDLAVVTEPTIEADFALARRYNEMAKLSWVQGAAFMILTGFELKRLKKKFGIHRGGDRKSKDQTRNVAGLIWPELVEKYLGVSQDTSERYMKLAEAAKTRLPLLDVEALLNTPLRDLPDLKRKQLTDAVQNLVGGETAQQLLWEWGINRRPKDHEYHPSTKNDEQRLDEAKWIMEEQTKILIHRLLNFPLDRVELLSKASLHTLVLTLDGLKANLRKFER